MKVKEPKDFVTLQEFIDFFESIPEDRWCINKFVDDDGRCCAAGHLGLRTSVGDTTARGVLRKLLLSINRRCSIAYINDGQNPDYQQDSPKKRILAFLNDCKSLQTYYHKDGEHSFWTREYRGGWIHGHVNGKKNIIKAELNGVTSKIYGTEVSARKWIREQLK